MLIHIVERGDTLSTIARRYGVSVSRILTDNGLTRDQILVVGQALIITLPSVVHTVRRGETASGIAAAYGLTLMELYQNNPELISEPVLRPGQLLTIRFRGNTGRELTTLGYAYPYVRRPVLRRALPYLTYLCIFSYGFREDGSLVGIDDSELISMAYRYRTAPVMVLTTITEEGSFSSRLAEQLLGDEALQNRVLDNIVDTMARKGYLGLDVDFEYIPGEYREEFQAFLRRAEARLRARGWFLTTALAPKTSAGQSGLLYEAVDYGAIGAIVDRAFIMTYEWGYTFGPPMAVAPLDEVRRVVRYAVTEIPTEKIIMGIPNYGYDWPLPYERGTTRAENIGVQGAVLRAARYGAEIRYDERAQSPYFNYNSGGTGHVVWFEDARSIEAKLRLAVEYDLNGVGYWNLMRPFNANWALIAARYRVRKVA